MKINEKRTLRRVWTQMVPQPVDSMMAMYNPNLEYIA